MDVALLVPATTLPGLPALRGVLLLPYETVLDFVASLRAISNPAVILSDGLPADALEAAAAAVRDHSAPCIEVRVEKWDGQAYSALSAGCRGVISGFGQRGLAAAVAALRDS